MPRGFVAFGVALVLGGCGKVTFGPLGDAAPDAEPQPDAEPIDMGPPDTGEPPDIGPPPDGGGCEVVLGPPAIAESSWPFNVATELQKKVTYSQIFWNDATTTALGCNAPSCHGYGDDGADSSAPLIPYDMATLDANYQAAIDQLWERVTMSDRAAQTGPMYAHHEVNGTPEAKPEQTWYLDNPSGMEKLAFIDRIIDDAHKCNTYRWFKTYESRLCTEGGGAQDAGAMDTGDGDAGDGDGGGVDGGAADSGPSCVCSQPFTDAMAGIDMMWARTNCTALPL